MTSVTLDGELLEGIERFIADRDEPPRGTMTHDDAVNVIVRDWLMGQGYIPLLEELRAKSPTLRRPDCNSSQKTAACLGRLQ